MSYHRKRFWSALVAAVLLATLPASAQTLLYHWDFNSATDTGASWAGPLTGGSGSGGILTNLNNGTGLASPAGSGLTGGAGDLAVVQAAYGVNNAGCAGALLGNLSSVKSFTVSAWFKLNATATNFGTYGSAGALNARILNIANAANGDGTRLYFSLNTGTNLQFGVNQASTGPATGQQGTTSGVFGLFGNAPATMTNQWIFVAASYTTNTALNGTVNLYVGSLTTPATLVATLTNVGTTAWDASGDYAYLGNRPSNGQRALPGSVDEVRIYDGAQTLAQIHATQTNAATGPFASVVGISPSSTINFGSSVTLTQSPSGLGPFTYQWRTDGGSGGAVTNVPAAANSSFTTTPGFIGTFKYDVIVTSGYGSSTSPVATVTVVSAPGTASVLVNVSSNLATVSDIAYGTHTSVYANQFGNASLATQIIQSGLGALRYPGGGYADVFHWSVTRPGLGGGNGYGFSPWQGGSYAYMGSQTDFGNFVRVLTNSQCEAVITVNWGSGLKWNAGHTALIAPTTNAEPPEAAAWVAYANSPTNIFGTVNDVTLGFDSLGNDWKTAGYWAMLRAAAPLGVDDGYNFLRLRRQAPLGIKYWEIGNETFGTGFYTAGGNDGYSVNYAVPYPWSTTARYGNTNLSPAVYGRGVKAFSQLMKQVDPTIKIGAVVSTPPDDTWDNYNGQRWIPEVLAQCATNIDFVIAHWYPYAGNDADGRALLAEVPATIPPMIVGTGSHTGNNAGLRDWINQHRADGTNVDIFITEFGYTGSLTNALNGQPIFGPVNTLFAADSYASWLKLGVAHVDWLELSKNTFLGDSNPLVRGAVYYAVLLNRLTAGPGDTVVATTSDVSTLRTHAAVRSDGSIGVMLLNTSLSNTVTVNIAIPNANLAASATRYQFGTNNFNGATPTPASGPTTNSVSVSGNLVSVSIPAYTMVVLTIPVTAAPTNNAPVLAAISNQTVNVGQIVAFTASATDTNTPAQTLTFTLLSGPTNATLNSSSGAFSFRPLVPQADTTNQFSLKVADNGTPSLSATQNFSVIVHPLLRPTLATSGLVGGQFALSFTGTSGPDYAIQASTNLTQWSTLLTTNSPALPFNWTDPNAANFPMEFYRVLVGPPLP